MTNDESPVDVAASNAATPADSAPHAGMAAASDAASATSTSSTPRRRRPSSSGTTRARKNTATDQDALPLIEEVPALPIHIEAPVVPAGGEFVPDAAGASPAKPPARRRGGTGSRHGARAAAVELRPAEALSESVQAADAPASAQISDAPGIPSPSAGKTTEPATEKTPRSRRRTTRKKDDEATGETGAIRETVEAAETRETTETVEAPSLETPGRSRRRGGRSRRKGPESGGSEETEGTTAAQETGELAAVAPVAESPVPDATAEKPARGRRGAGRKRVERTEEPEDISRSGARLVSRRGLVELQINGETYPPVLFFGNVENEKEIRRVTSEVQRAAQSGVHLHSTLVELTCPLPPDDSVYETFDSRIETLLNADPKGHFIPRIVFVPAAGWRRQYPNEVNHYSDGTTDDPSIASNHFWQEAESALTALIEHVQRMGYGERVVGYHLERGEWFHPADGGYDRSYANREAFRAWLRTKYKNSEASLRAAWYDGQVQFYTAEIPTLPASPRPDVTFFEPRKERRWIDFLEYTSEVTADRLISLSRAVKTASHNRALVSVCYGYIFEFGHTFSGHLALGRLLQSPTVDIIAGPPSYRDRQPGGGGSFPAPADSMALHGKLWLSEDDTKTHLAPTTASPDDFNPRIDSRWGTEQVQKRAMGKALAHRSAVAWMDTWGEGWLDADDIWKSIADFTARYRELINSRKTWTPDVVVLVDERSLLHVQKGEAFIRRLLREQRDVIQQSGASVGFYLQSDVLAKNFPTDARLYLFLTPYRLPADQRAAIKEKILQGGKTVVWMFAPGLCDSRGEPEEGARELVGITLRQQSWNSEIGSKITDARHAITEGIQNRLVGARERLNPSFSIDDDSKGIVIVGEYQQTGLPSIAVREMDGWRSVFCGEPTLSAELFRGLCRYAGVHLYTTGGDDFVFAGDGWLTLHTTRDGNRVIQLPPARDLYSLDEMRLVARDSSEYRAFLKGRTTYSFYVGTADEMRKLGLPVERVTPQRRGRRGSAGSTSPNSTVTADVVDTAGRADTQVRPYKLDFTVTADVVDSVADEAALEPLLPVQAIPQEVKSAAFHTVEAALSLDPESSIEEDAASVGDPADGETGDDSPEAAVEGESAESAEHRRRRRRRGGRGRGRRRPPGAGPEADGAPEAGGAPASVE